MHSTEFSEESIIPQNCLQWSHPLKSVDNDHGIEEVEFRFLSSKKNKELYLRPISSGKIFA